MFHCDTVTFRFHVDAAGSGTSGIVSQSDLALLLRKQHVQSLLFVQFESDIVRHPTALQCGTRTSTIHGHDFDAFEQRCCHTRAFARNGSAIRLQAISRAGIGRHMHINILARLDHSTEDRSGGIDVDRNTPLAVFDLQTWIVSDGVEH